MTIMIRILLVALALNSAIGLGAEQRKSKYRGFTIVDSGNIPASERIAIYRSIEEQIDIVCSVGVPAAFFNFLQTVPIKLVPAGDATQKSIGCYRHSELSVIILSSIAAAPRKPILLHELMHAFHDQKLEGGFRNSVIRGFFSQAQSGLLFESKSHMMRNAGEFFACASTTYLFGVTVQEPYNRENLKKRQPDFFDYLTKLFSPTAGVFKGSITR